MSAFNARMGELRMGFTSDRVDRAGYCRLYEKLFSETEGAGAYRHVEDAHDRDGHVLVVTVDGQCVGGARLSVAGGGSTAAALPIEIDSFRLEDHFPSVRGKPYGQIGHLCLTRALRGGRVTREMFRHLHAKAWSLGLADVFGTAVMVNARAYRSACFSLGLRNVAIHPEVPLPPYPMCGDVPFHLFHIPVDSPPRV